MKTNLLIGLLVAFLYIDKIKPITAIVPIKKIVEKSTTTILLLKNDKKHNAIIVSTDKGSSNLDKAEYFVDLKDKTKAPPPAKKMPKEEIKRRFSKVFKASPPKALSYILYFEKNSMNLTENSKKIFQEALNSIKAYSPAVVDIIGHTDTTGSNKINIKVSLKRAKHIKLLLENKDVKAVSLTAKGYGEEDLLIPTSDNQQELKNRNVEIFIK